MEILMPQYTNQTNQTTMDLTLTTTFESLLKHSCIRSTNYNVNNQFIGLQQNFDFALRK